MVFLWGSSITNYSIASQLAVYTETPQCGYDISFDLKYRDSTNTLVDAIPIEIQDPSDLSSGLFTFDKCSAGNGETNGIADSDCNNPSAYQEMEFELVIVATLTDNSVTIDTDSSKHFTVTVTT